MFCLPTGLHLGIRFLRERTLVFLRAGLRQSMGIGRTEDDSVDNEDEAEVERTTKSEVINLEVESGNPVIDGGGLKVSLSKKDAQVFGAVRLWHKTKRNTLTPEA